MARRERAPRSRTFVYRGGTRIAGTVIACDASSGGDLLFLSNGLGQLDVGTPRARSGGAGRAARAQILTTPETLAIMGAAGERLRPRALTVGYGRPFGLGSLRLELVPAGVLPGAAALACDDGTRRVLYAGLARLGAPGRGVAPGEVRAADALCLDATFGHPRFRFVERGEVEERARRFARESRDLGRPAVLLAAALGPAPDLAAALAAEGWKLRGHRSIIDAAAAYQRAGVAGPPIARFTGKLGRNEVLLWPAGPRDAGLVRRRVGSEARMAWVSGFACDPDAVARLAPDEAIPYAHAADFEGLLAYAAATGAREIAVKNGFAEDLAAAFRERGTDAYVIGPPRQIDLIL
jgi:putative mRNA 3-end processing factor